MPGFSYVSWSLDMFLLMITLYFNIYLVFLSEAQKYNFNSVYGSHLIAWHIVGDQHVFIDYIIVWIELSWLMGIVIYFKILYCHLGNKLNCNEKAEITKSSVKQK